METSEQQLRAYLEAHPVFKIARLEEAAGLPSNSLQRWLNRTMVRNIPSTLSQENQQKLVAYLKQQLPFD